MPVSGLCSSSADAKSKFSCASPCFESFQCLQLFEFLNFIFKAAQSLDQRDPITQLANGDPVPAALGPTWSHNGPHLFEGSAYKRSSLVLGDLTLLLVAPRPEPLWPLPTPRDSFPFGLPSPCAFMFSSPFPAASIFVHLLAWGVNANEHDEIFLNCSCCLISVLSNTSPFRTQ